ncbi:MAG: RNA 3'-terminal phosphate cyclase [Thermoanaerobaculia bacterium]|nr:RNA 3'-terminal phosphate cyclase [Thermoanaerobaculia bacterium]
MMLRIDGSKGEGGGQIVRSSLTLAMLAGRPVHIRKVRAGRRKPGLLRQHLTAVRAAAEISDGKLVDARLGASEFRFTPARVHGGRYEFSVGSAGSAMLVLQTVLLPLCLAEEPSELVLEGGTHNPWAPTFDFLQRTFLPLLALMGPTVHAELERPGFYPAGGGRVRVEIEPVSELVPIDLLDRGEALERRAVASVANLSPGIARRELKAVRSALSWDEGCLRVEEIEGARGPGNVVRLEIRSACESLGEGGSVTEVATGFGRRSATAERVAREACAEAKEYLASGAPVGVHLADQLILPMAVAGRGAFRTQAPSRHTLTQIDLVRHFRGGRVRDDLPITVDRDGATPQWLVQVGET